MKVIQIKKSLKEKIKKASSESSYEASLIINAFKSLNTSKNLNWYEFYTKDILELCAELYEKGILSHSVSKETVMPFCELKKPDAIVDSLTLRSCIVWRNSSGLIDNPTGAAIIAPMNILIYASNGVLASPISNGPVIANFEDNLSGVNVKFKFGGFKETSLSVKMLWAQGGNIHNSNGPAIITTDGILIYMNRGKIHRTNGHAIKTFDVNSLVESGQSGDSEKDIGFDFKNGEIQKKTPV